jgi:hypothetical protein
MNIGKKALAIYAHHYKWVDAHCKGDYQVKKILAKELALAEVKARSEMLGLKELMPIDSFIKHNI